MSRLLLPTPDKATLPVLVLPGVLTLPGLMAPLLIEQPLQLAAVERAASEHGPLALFWGRQGTDLDHLPSIGVSARIVRLIRLPAGPIQLIVQGIARVRFISVVSRDPVPTLLIQTLEPPNADLSANPLREAVLNSMRVVAALSPTIPEEMVIVAANATDAGELADIVGASIELKPQERQQVLDEIDPLKRLELALQFCEEKRTYLEVSRKIQEEVSGRAGKTQREYLLREQLRAIQRELGELEPQEAEVNELRRQAEARHLPAEVKDEADRELARLAQINPASPEHAVIRTRLDWILSLPWEDPPPSTIDLDRARAVLDADHYGLDKVKERIIEFLAITRLRSGPHGPILCFVGPPGVGKTSLGQSIARALGRPFVRASLGGMRDEAEIRGHRRTYVGAMPGRIVEGMRKAGQRNPVFMLDEVDKLAVGFQGDPAAALLEVLDPAQNHAFTDHYLDLPYDLSLVFFICTANVLDPVPPALRDRMEVIELPGYMEQEKLQIARRHLLPRQMAEHALPDGSVVFTNQILVALVRGWTVEAGVRQLERALASCCRKVATRRARGDQQMVTIVEPQLTEWLGPPIEGTVLEEAESVGAATGLAWTVAGGEILTIEASLVPGSGQLTLTGHMGEVMQESARAAITYARSRAAELGLPADLFKSSDVHVHVPAGAVPKDGPSAGIALATALVSAATRRPVNRRWAMTGEVTLRGHVLPVGGIKEKVLAAHRVGVEGVILPRRNARDLVDIPAEIRQAIRFELVDDMDQVLAIALKRVTTPTPAPAVAAEPEPVAARSVQTVAR
ncbi:MAG TPA: endopeptidase La [Candidatus Limnocylindrales bacterium]|nr:endopeptidase La [Candidatus Limnocylindrales bacterium]